MLAPNRYAVSVPTAGAVVVTSTATVADGEQLTPKTWMTCPLDVASATETSQVETTPLTEASLPNVQPAGASISTAPFATAVELPPLRVKSSEPVDAESTCPGK